MLQREIEDNYAGFDENDLEECRVRNNDPWVKFPVDLSMSNRELFFYESNAEDEWARCGGEDFHLILEKHCMLFQVDRAAREMLYRKQLTDGYESRFPEKKQNAEPALSGHNPSLPSLKLNLEGFLSNFSNEKKLKA